MSPLPQTPAEQNDQLRTTLLTGRLVLTEGVRSLPDNIRCQVVFAVRSYSNFTAENDPYGERDFGAVDHPTAGRIFWKIDHPDPCDPSERVLTIMLASEY